MADPRASVLDDPGRRIAAVAVVAVVEKWKNLSFSTFPQPSKLLRFEGYQTEITEIPLRYLVLFAFYEIFHEWNSFSLSEFDTYKWNMKEH
jgi:hypothetical protein